jgi:purine-cytosine permease-like protein
MWEKGTAQWATSPYCTAGPGWRYKVKKFIMFLLWAGAAISISEIYSYRAEDRLNASGAPFAGYFLGSVLMYGFGLFISLKTGSDFFTFIAASRFWLIACAVVVLSTLITAFLDLYSAAVSSTRIIPVKNREIKTQTTQTKAEISNKKSVRLVVNTIPLRSGT